jgi:hypothetical protein
VLGTVGGDVTSPARTRFNPIRLGCLVAVLAVVIAVCLVLPQYYPRLGRYFSRQSDREVLSYLLPNAVMDIVRIERSEVVLSSWSVNGHAGFVLRTSPPAIDLLNHSDGWAKRARWGESGKSPGILYDGPGSFAPRVFSGMRSDWTELYENITTVTQTRRQGASSLRRVSIPVYSVLVADTDSSPTIRMYLTTSPICFEGRLTRGAQSGEGDEVSLEID